MRESSSIISGEYCLGESFSAFERRSKAWVEFSRYIRLRDAIKTTQTKEWAVCCSCSKQYPAFGVGCGQAGHFVPGRGNAILFDEDCVHFQCYNCNVRLKGNWPAYMEFMLKEYGREVVDELLRLNKTIRQYREPELEEIRDKYKQKFKLLQAET